VPQSTSYDGELLRDVPAPSVLWAEGIESMQLVRNRNESSNLVDDVGLMQALFERAVMESTSASGSGLTDLSNFSVCATLFRCLQKRLEMSSFHQ
jgi:hypothetical protein